MSSSGFASRLLFFLLVLSSPLLGAPCTSSTYQISGSVRDANGNPIADASVFLLLDVVSEKKFHQHGMRAARFRTDGTGRYHAEIAYKGANRSQATPCAKRPRDLTVAASTGGHRLRLRSFKLKKLLVVEHFGFCHVQVPDLVLSTDR